MARFDKPVIVSQTLRGGVLSVEIPEPNIVIQAVAVHFEEMRRAPSAVTRSNRQRLVALLARIPCLGNFDSGEDLARHWWVSFDLDISSPIAWRVVAKLGLLLNTPCSSKRMSVGFKPRPQEDTTETMRWEIATTAAGLDPNDVARWLRENLPQPLEEQGAWEEDE
jgi:hypothetical protein